MSFLRFVLCSLLLFIFFPKKQFSQLDQVRILDDEYFIVFKQSPSRPGEIAYQLNKENIYELESIVGSLGGTVIDSFYYAFVGLHVRLDLPQLMQIAKDSRIEFISKNGQAYLFEDKSSTKNWGVDRIDQRDLPLDDTFQIPYKGVGSHVYVIDTGLRESHQEFTSRVGNGFSALPDDPSTKDCNGHGTHVAGSVAGMTVGVAVESIIHPVRVFGCNGSTTWDIIIKAIEWVIANHESPASINLSLGGGGNDAIDKAVQNAVKAGISVVVAAGNSNQDACSYSPAREPLAITVGATTNRDQRASFSNFGSCLDLFAPGSSIVSASHQADDMYVSLSGTSMASPHVAGASALVQALYPQKTPTDIAKHLISYSTKDKVRDTSTSKNALLYVKQLSEAPIVDAGKDIIKRFPDNNVTLIGVAKDADGFIIESSWAQISGPPLDIESFAFDWEQQLVLEGLEVGEYVFRFTAQDNMGFSSFDEVQVIISDKNFPPIADAGKDIRIVLDSDVKLSAEKSFDRDGEVVEFKWQQISGPNDAQIDLPNEVVTPISNLISGRYVFEVSVWDQEGALSKDSVKVHVNHPPVVDAGDDQEIDVSQATITLSGNATDPDGNKVQVKWSKTKGPKGAVILKPNSLITQVKGLQEGKYVFRLTATDDMTVSRFDEVVVTVIKQNSAPIVSAGEDKEIILPNDSIVLEGSCVDEDGKCIKMTWKYVATNLIPKSLDSYQLQSKLFLSNLTKGTYRFVLQAVDNEGLSSEDSVSVTVTE